MWNININIQYTIFDYFESAMQTEDA